MVLKQLQIRTPSIKDIEQQLLAELFLKMNGTLGEYWPMCNRKVLHREVAYTKRLHYILNIWHTDRTYSYTIHQETNIDVKDISQKI